VRQPQPGTRTTSRVDVLQGSRVASRRGPDECFGDSGDEIESSLRNLGAGVSDVPDNVRGACKLALTFANREEEGCSDHQSEFVPALLVQLLAPLAVSLGVALDQLPDEFEVGTAVSHVPCPFYV